jgi:hypothetical protein
LCSTDTARLVQARLRAPTLRYRICEIASPTNCDVADVAITVKAFPIDAVNDTGAAREPAAPRR